jgi:hypothetical protein
MDNHNGYSEHGGGPAASRHVVTGMALGDCGVGRSGFQRRTGTAQMIRRKARLP